MVLVFSTFPLSPRRLEQTVSVLVTGRSSCAVERT